MDFGRRRAQIVAKPIALLIGHALPPAYRGIVIVRACVNDEIRVMIVWQVQIAAVTAKGELQNRHAGQIKSSTQTHHIWRDDTEILSNDG